MEWIRSRYSAFAVFFQCFWIDVHFVVFWKPRRGSEWTSERGRKVWTSGRQRCWMKCFLPIRKDRSSFFEDFDSKRFILTSWTHNYKRIYVLQVPWRKLGFGGDYLTTCISLPSEEVRNLSKLLRSSRGHRFSTVILILTRLKKRKVCVMAVAWFCLRCQTNPTQKNTFFYFGCTSNFHFFYTF